MKELKKHPDISREDTRLYFAKLNQAGAITVLDFLDDTQASALCAKLMSEVNQIPCIKEGSTFKAYHDLTGKEYEYELKIAKGKVAIPGKILPTTIKPQNLIGKKEGAKITIAGQPYVIREIR